MLILDLDRISFAFWRMFIDPTSLNLENCWLLINFHIHDWVSRSQLMLNHGSWLIMCSWLFTQGEKINEVQPISDFSYISLNYRNHCSAFISDLLQLRAVLQQHDSRSACFCLVPRFCPYLRLSIWTHYSIVLHSSKAGTRKRREYHTFDGMAARILRSLRNNVNSFRVLGKYSVPRCHQIRYPFNCTFWEKTAWLNSRIEIGALWERINHGQGKV